MFPSYVSIRRNCYQHLQMNVLERSYLNVYNIHIVVIFFVGYNKIIKILYGKLLFLVSL